MLNYKSISLLLLIAIFLRPSAGEVNSIYISSKLDPNAIIITQVDIVFVYAQDILEKFPSTKTAWYSNQRRFISEAGDKIDLVSVFIPQGFDSQSVSLPQRGNDALNQAVEVMARADAQVGKSIAAFEQHAARTGQDMSASINDLIVTWSETTGKAMVDQIRIAKELEDAAKKSTIALDMVITRMQAMSAVSSRASSAMDDARRINTMQVETRLGQPKFQASNRF